MKQSKIGVTLRTVILTCAGNTPKTARVTFHSYIIKVIL